jgi:hypothetical protein
VLAPVAVLGLLGVGYGAFAFGKAPESAPLPPAATTTTSSSVPVGGGMTPEAWAKQVEALCLRQDAELLKLGPLDSPDNLSEYLTQLIDMGERYSRAFVQLGWPRSAKSTVVAARAVDAEGLAAARRLLTAYNQGDGPTFKRNLRRLTKLDGQFDDLMRRLGTEKCIDNPLKAKMQAKAKAGEKELQQPKSAEAILKSALLSRSKAVVVFYTPDSVLDSTAVLEARAGAEDAGAAFVAVNASVNREVEMLANQYDVLETPAVLIFVRGPRVVSRFGFVDRTTVAQAVVNARG